VGVLVRKKKGAKRNPLDAGGGSFWGIEPWGADWGEGMRKNALRGLEEPPRQRRCKLGRAIVTG